MVGVHIGLDLKDKAGDLRITRSDMGIPPRTQGLQGLGRRCIGPKTGQELIHPEMAQGRAEKDRRHMAL